MEGFQQRGPESRHRKDNQQGNRGHSHMASSACIIEYHDDLPPGVPALCMSQRTPQGEVLHVHLRSDLDPELEQQILDGVVRVEEGGPRPSQIGQPMIRDAS